MKASSGAAAVWGAASSDAVLSDVVLEALSALSDAVSSSGEALALGSASGAE